MPLNFVRSRGGDFSRQIIRFDANDGQRDIRCAVSYTAMDDYERARDVKPAERDAQFERLRGQIIEAASRKFYRREIETAPGDDIEVLVKRADLAEIPKDL